MRRFPSARLLLLACLLLWSVPGWSQIIQQPSPAPPGTGGGVSLATPTGVVGLTVVPGSATTALRSDSAPALSQAISPTWTGPHTFSGHPLTVQNVGPAEIRLADTNGPGAWTSQSADFIWSGVHNHTFGFGYNSDLALATMPQWTESIEPRYVPGSPPNGLFEKHWNYTSIDRSVTYRPMGFSIDLNTHLASQKWYVADYRVLGRTDAENGGESFRVDTAGKAVHASALVAGVMGTTTNWPLEVRGPTKGNTAFGLAPTVSAGDTVIYIAPTAVTGDLTWINANSSVSGKAEANFWNTGAGGAVFQILSNGGDAWFRFYTVAQSWALGSDKSDASSFKLSNSDTLGANDRLIITAAGAVTIPDLATIGAAAGKTAVCADTAGRLYRSSASGSCAN